MIQFDEGQMSISRRGLMLGLPLFLAGCASTYKPNNDYGPRLEEKFPLKEVPRESIKPELRRTEVDYPTA